MLNLTIVNSSGAKVPRAFLQNWVEQLFRLIEKSEKGAIPIARLRDKDLVIAFLPKKEARKINLQFRGKDYATDVLSFESDEPSSLGELVICPEVIAKQAKEHGLLLREELGYMVLHGILHLLGFDHEQSEREAKRMFELQDRLFETLLDSGSHSKPKTARKRPSKRS